MFRLFTSSFLSRLLHIELSKRKLFFLFLLCFLIKLASILYLLQLTHCYPGADFRHRGFIAWLAGDTPTYLEPIDNYLEKGEFYFTNAASEKVYIGRGPYYGAPYFLFRLFFNQTVSYNLFAFLQIALASLAVLYYCLLCRAVVINSRQRNSGSDNSRLSGNLSFWLCYILFNVSLNATVWDNQLWTESMHISLFGFFAYHYFNYITLRTRKSFFYSSLFLALIVSIKPIFSLLYIGVVIELLFLSRNRGQQLSQWGVRTFVNFVRDGFIFSIPLLLLTAPWTIRNFVKYKRMVPVQEFYAYHSNSATLAYSNFLRAWGGSVVHWDKRSAGCYFEPSPLEECEYVFPDYVFTKNFSMKDIEEVRNDFIRFQHDLHNKALEDTVAQKFNHLTQSFKNEKPFFYYVITPLLCAKKMIFHSGSYYLPIGKNSTCYKPYQMLLKLSQSALYYLFLIFGWWGLLKMMRVKGMLLCASLPFFLILLMCFYLRATEFRYFDTTNPFFILGFVYLIQSFCFRFISVGEY